MDFTGQTVVVTGAASGIGKGTALAFLARGAKVALMDINEAGLDDVVNENQSKAEKLLKLPTDITNSGAVDDSIAKLIEWSGQIDILVNSAGLYVQSMVTDMTDSFWDKTMKINLYGSFYCCRSVAKEMIKKKYGRIINFGSIAGQRGSMANAHYTTTKRGIEGFSRSLALELAPHNINVNCIAPGIILTPIFSEEILKERGDVWLQTVPKGRFGTPEDIANGVMFLCSKYADYITGFTLDINGGMYIR